MTRVALIGNAAGGKSTLAKALAARHGLPLCQVDHVQFGPDWAPAPEGEVAAQLDAVADGQRWIIDGWGPWTSIERRFDLADTIIWIDHPLWVHMLWAARRQLTLLRGPLPPGVHPGARTRMIYQVIRNVDRAKPRLASLIDRYAEGRDVHHLASPGALKRFAAHYA